MDGLAARDRVCKLVERRQCMETTGRPPFISGGNGSECRSRFDNAGRERTHKSNKTFEFIMLPDRDIRPVVSMANASDSTSLFIIYCMLNHLTGTKSTQEGIDLRKLTLSDALLLQGRALLGP
jgi:hypothetical protein